MKNKKLLGLLLLAAMSISACSINMGNDSKSEQSKSSQESQSSSVVSSSAEASSSSVSSTEPVVSSSQSSSQVAPISSSEEPSISSEEAPISTSEEAPASSEQAPISSSEEPSISSEPEVSSEEPSTSSEEAQVSSEEPSSEPSSEPEQSSAVESSEPESSSEEPSSEEPSSEIEPSSEPASSQSSSSEAASETGYFEFDYDELETPQVIHTTDQQNYLNYDGEYYQINGNILDSFNARGNTNVSTPNPVTIHWEYDVPSGKTLKNYSLIFSQNEDLSDPIEVTGNKNKSISFYNSYLGTNYFQVVAHFTDNTIDESNIEMFEVDEQAPRNLKVGNMPNCRDMGGRTTYAGGKVKQGLIYRTSGSKFDNRTDSDQEAKNVLLNDLGVKTEINVANSTTNNVNLTGVDVVNAYMAYGSVPYSNLARNSVRIRQVMDILADEDNYPVFYHCRIGTDRTGITGVMIGGLLGVPFNEIIQDYCFSNFAPIDNQRYPGKTPDNNGDDIKKYIDELLALPGETFQEKTYLALRMIGVSAEKLDTIIDIMTEGDKADIPDTAKIGENTDLSSTGTKQTSSDYKAPATYYNVPNNGTISYTVTTTSGNKDIIVYLGTTQSVSTSTTTKLSAALSLKIDGVAQTITNTKNLWQAGFGSTQQDNRYGYMFNNLGLYNLSAGQHTVEITVKSGPFNIASITVADHI